MNAHDRQELLTLHGITREYIDAWGQAATISEENLDALLKTMGYAIDDDVRVHAQIQQDLMAHWGSYLSPVYTSRLGEPIYIELRIAQTQRQQWFHWYIDTEQGERLSGSFHAIDYPVEKSEELDDRQYLALRVPLKIQLPCGYHKLALSFIDEPEPIARSRYVVAQTRAYKPPAIAHGLRVWGVTVQLYSLRSERNWGVGDFTDLCYLVTHIARGGGGFVGLNPLHALYPAWPELASPYSPSSRRWINIIYIDVEAITEFSSSAAAPLVSSPEFVEKIRTLRASDYVQYTQVSELKLKCLRLVYQQFCQLESYHSRQLAFTEFCQREGKSLKAQASFDALQHAFKDDSKIGPHWNSWPQSFQNYESTQTQQWISEHLDEVNFFSWLQWIAAEQLAKAGLQAQHEHMALGLYFDVAVGVSAGSQETWHNRQQYNLLSHIGAPPDVLGPLGQDWGLPPPDPLRLQEQHYQPIIDVFRRNMRFCGALRIDHVMGLMRLWWVPSGRGAKNGAYVNYPLKDLLAILVLESHRNQCLVVGEDLGTVPDQIYAQLQENGIHSYRVFFFSQASDGGFISPHHYPEQALAALTTHDMATLTGFWHCYDLKLGAKLGLYPDEQRLKKLFDDRLFCKQQILNSLHGHHSIPDDIGTDASWVSMSRTLNHCLQLHMARGNSALLSLQLEDWLEMTQPVNVPGTSDEYPNWRRKLSMTLENLFAQPHIIKLMQQLTEARQQATPR
ncbi:4-alpha-glucanotransferase [Celerinatantimonas sp. MCCC 1A17872]|uniref:4-alpha-glucanotransferase n=1 Tax=Celerinatantimonas sp. MCCC 1A17872 TaxID=3177514 RepID=UPI0038CBD584